MKIILVNPQIPQNTGNIVRTSSVAGCSLTLVEPLGFNITDRWLKRAGLDYWEGVEVSVVANLDDLLEQATGNFYFFSSKADQLYTDVSYKPDDWLIFGSETSGLPPHYYQRWPQRFLRIPMRSNARCLNLATSAGIVTYEALRQQGFPSLL